MQSFTTKFTLSKEYLSECFDQSLPHGKNAKPNYIFPVLFISSGSGLLAFSELSKFTSSILLVLGLLELFHIRYRRAWWLVRQMLAKSSGSEITLTLDENGIQTQNPYTSTIISWVDIKRVIETDLGFILVTKSGEQQYLSKSLFPEELINEIIAKNTGVE